jgi:hypothetical protein
MDAGNSEDVAALKAEIEALSQKVDKHKQGYEEMKAAEDADPNTAAALAAEEQETAELYKSLAKAAQVMQSAEEEEAGKRADVDAAEVLKLRLAAYGNCDIVIHACYLHEGRHTITSRTTL